MKLCLPVRRGNPYAPMAFYNDYYRAVDEGKKLLGSFDNNIWSGKAGVKFGVQTVTVGYQRSNGNDDFDYLRQSDSIFLDNSIQYSNFNSPKEQSLQLRYDLDCKLSAFRA